MSRFPAPPKEFSAYLVTNSTEPAIPVGSTLIEKGKLLNRDWEAMDFTTMKSTFAVGVRLLRLCPDCRVKHKAIGVLGHDGECGTEVVKDEAVAELKHAKKQVTP